LSGVLASAIREAAGFPELRIHDLRHSFVSNQLAAGTPIHVVREMAAHRSLPVTALYAHASDEARRAAAQRLEIRVGTKAAPVVDPL
jgi:integrase